MPSVSHIYSILDAGSLKINFSQIERGEANVTIKTMKVLANALEVELKTLFDFTF